MNFRFKIIIMAAIICSGSIITGYFMGFFTHKNKEDLWHQEPKVLLNGGPPELWWYRGIKKDKIYGSYHDSTDALVDALKANVSDVLTNNYIIDYVNAYNNTVFVVVKSLDPEVKQAFLDVMKPKPGVTIIFRKGPVSFIEINKWFKVIRSELENLREKGVLVISYKLSVNGTIQIGINDIDSEKVEIILDVLDGRVPPGILVLCKQEIPQID